MITKKEICDAIHRTFGCLCIKDKYCQAVEEVYRKVSETCQD